MALFLTEKEVSRLLTMDMAIEAVESAHRDLALGQAQDTPRARTRLPQTVLHILQGALPAQGVIGYKAYTTNRSGNRFLVHMFDAASGQKHTQHTLNRVPALLFNAPAGVRSLADGKLADVAPTLLELIGVPQPAEMTGKSMLSAASRPMAALSTAWQPMHRYFCTSFSPAAPAWAWRPKAESAASAARVKSFMLQLPDG